MTSRLCMPAATRRSVVAGLAVALLTGSRGVARGLESEPSRTLAPTGRLRAGLYPGTPTSILTDDKNGPHGVGYEIGKELARQLDVGYEPVVFSKNAEVLQAVASGAVDVAFTNATMLRAKEMDFGPPYLEIELGYLVPAGSVLIDMEDVDSSGRRVGVTGGSTSDGALSHDLKNASVVRAPTLKDAIELLRSHQIDAFATNKATLFQMAEQLPGSRVLEGRWGLERHAIAIPKGRAAGLEFLRKFTVELKASGLIKAAAERAGLRGVVAP